MARAQQATERYGPECFEKERTPELQASILVGLKPRFSSWRSQLPRNLLQRLITYPVGSVHLACQKGNELWARASMRSVLAKSDLSRKHLTLSQIDDWSWPLSQHHVTQLRYPLFTVILNLLLLMLGQKTNNSTFVDFHLARSCSDVLASARCQDLARDLSKTIPDESWLSLQHCTHCGLVRSNAPRYNSR